MQYVVGVAEMMVSAQKGDRIITYALGSCLGITVFDPVLKIGGLLHIMLPSSTIDPQKALKNPYMFVDTGVPKLFEECYRLGAVKERMIIKVAGGACINLNTNEDIFEIGKRNFLIFKKLLLKNNLVLKGCDVGGHHARTMYLDIDTGNVTIKTIGLLRQL